MGFLQAISAVKFKRNPAFGCLLVNKIYLYTLPSMLYKEKYNFNTLHAHSALHYGHASLLRLLLLNTQTRPHVLVHNITDTDGWYDFHEVGQDAAVESKEALIFHNLLHHPVH